MHYHAAIVQQDPGAVTVALAAERILAGLLLQCLLHSAAEGVDLGVGGTAGNDKIVSDGGKIGDLNGGDLLALLLVQGLCGNDSQFLRCHI